MKNKAAQREKWMKKLYMGLGILNMARNFEAVL